MQPKQSAPKCNCSSSFLNLPELSNVGNIPEFRYMSDYEILLKNLCSLSVLRKKEGNCELFQEDRARSYRFCADPIVQF